MKKAERGASFFFRQPAGPVAAAAAVGLAAVAMKSGRADAPADTTPVRDSSPSNFLIADSPLVRATAFEHGGKQVTVKPRNEVDGHTLQPNTTDNPRRGMWFYTLRTKKQVKHVYPGPEGKDLTVVVKRRGEPQPEPNVEPKRPDPAQEEGPRQPEPERAQPARPEASMPLPAGPSLVTVRVRQPAAEGASRVRVKMPDRSERRQRAERAPVERDRTEASAPAAEAVELAPVAPSETPPAASQLADTSETGISDPGEAPATEALPADAPALEPAAPPAAEPAEAAAPAAPAPAEPPPAPAEPPPPPAPEPPSPPAPPPPPVEPPAPVQPEVPADENEGDAVDIDVPFDPALLQNHPDEVDDDDD